jgi:AcrR family transcriptional regulator
MRRPTERKPELLDAIVEYVYRNGVSDLSLRPLAKALGTSSRMLIYHFETKERMLAEVAAAARARQYAMLEEWTRDGADLPELVLSYWEWASADTSRPYLRLFFEVFALAAQGRPGTSGVLDALSRDSRRFFGSVAQRSGLEPAVADELALLAIATLRGLLFELLCTGDRSRLDPALERFLGQLERELDSQKE